MASKASIPCAKMLFWGTVWNYSRAWHSTRIRVTKLGVEKFLPWILFGGRAPRARSNIQFWDSSTAIQDGLRMHKVKLSTCQIIRVLFLTGKEAQSVSESYHVWSILEIHCVIYSRVSRAVYFVPSQPEVVQFKASQPRQVENRKEIGRNKFGISNRN